MKKRKKMSLKANERKQKKKEERESKGLVKTPNFCICRDITSICVCEREKEKVRDMMKREAIFCVNEVRLRRISGIIHHNGVTKDEPGEMKARIIHSHDGVRMAGDWSMWVWRRVLCATYCSSSSCSS